LLELLFALLAWRFGLGSRLGVYLSYTCVMLVAFVIDLEHRLVLNVVTYPAMAVVFGFSWLVPEIGPVHSVLAGVFGAVTLSLPLIVYRRGIGLGWAFNPRDSHGPETVEQVAGRRMRPYPTGT